MAESGAGSLEDAWRVPGRNPCGRLKKTEHVVVSDGTHETHQERYLL